MFNQYTPLSSQTELNIILRLQQDLYYGPYKSRAVMTEDQIQGASSCASGKRGCPETITGCLGEDTGNGRRRKCGCVKTSDKLKEILQTSFSNPHPPATALNVYQVATKCDKASGYGYGQGEKKQPTEGCGGLSGKHKMESCQHGKHPHSSHETTGEVEECRPMKYGQRKSKSWRIVSELVSLVQLSVTATALALYYLIYCYMQLVYYTLRSALYFHNADGPMKITIGVVTLTSLIVAFNILMRMEGIIGIVY